MDDNIYAGVYDRVNTHLFPAVAKQLRLAIPFLQLESDAMVDMAAKRVVAHFKTTILSSQPDVKTEILHFTSDVPLTGWDHLKKQMPRWLRRLFSPVRYTEFDTTTHIAITQNCPHVSEQNTFMHVEFLLGAPYAPVANDVRGPA